MATISYKHGETQFADDNGAVLASGTIEFFEPDGAFTTNKDTYTTSTLAVANANPMTLAANGRLANDVFLDGDYDYRIKDSAGVIIASPQNINPVSSAGSFAISADDSISATHAGGLIEASGTTTLTLDTASTLTEGFWVRVANVGSGTVTFARNDAANTIDGTTANITIKPNEGITVVVNNGETGFITFRTSELIATLTTTGDIIYASAANTPARLAKGTAGQSLVMNQGVTAPAYITRHNYISGLIPSIDGTDAVNDISVTTGQCADTTGAAIMSGGAMIKRIDADWVAGTNQGGFPSALTLTDDTWYHIFAIFDVTNGLTDYGFDTSLTATNLLADATDYSLYRRIGSILRGTATNVDFVIFEISGGGTQVLWKDPPKDVSVSNLGTSATLYVLSTPLGIQVLTNITTIGEAGIYVYISSPDQDDEAPSTTAAPLHTITTSIISHVNIVVDTSGQIRARADTASTSFKVVTNGWIDYRR